MLYLFLAIGCSVSISILMKNRRRFVENEMAMFMANYIICTLLSRYYSGAPAFNKEASFSVYLGILSGFLYLFSFVLSDRNVEKNGMIMASTFGKLGVLVPTFLSIFLFSQKLSLVQSVGFGLAILAIIMIYFEKDGLALITSRGLLLFHMFTSGITDATISIYDHYGAALYKDQFLLINFFFALIFAAITVILRKKKVKASELLYGVAIGVPNFYSARFLMYSLESVPSIIAYPFTSIGGILMISLCGTLLFKEKLSQKKIIALGIIVVALVLLNI